MMYSLKYNLPSMRMVYIITFYLSDKTTPFIKKKIIFGLTSLELKKMIEITKCISFSLASTCNESLVDTVTDDKLTASSHVTISYSADKARMSSIGWIPSIIDDSWIQVHVY